MSYVTAKTDMEVCGSESALRAVCRAVIRRVCDEHPDSVGYELFLRLWAAYPFGPVEGVVQQVWFEEVLGAVGGIEAFRDRIPLAWRATDGTPGWIQ